MFNCLLSLGPASLGYKRWGQMTSGGFSVLLTLFPRCWSHELQIADQKGCKEHRIQIPFARIFSVSLDLMYFWKHAEKSQVEALINGIESGEDSVYTESHIGNWQSFDEIPLSQVF